MNIDYLYSIVNLYLKKEVNNKKIILNIKKQDTDVEFNFRMNEKEEEKTNFTIPLDEYNSHLYEFISIYKNDLMIIDEKYNYNNVNNTCYYYVLFKTGRVISFDGFTILEMNNIRNFMYGININKEEIRVSGVEEEKQMAYKPRLTLQQAGFSSYATLFLTVLFFADVLVIALWIFKLIMN